MKTPVLTLAAWAVAAFAAAPLLAVEIDGVAATVGGETILKSEVRSEMRRSGLSPDRFNETLNALVERKLVIQAASQAKMTIQDWVVDNRVREIVESAFGGDRNRLSAALAKEKIPYAEWRDRVKDDLVAAAMRWNIVEKNVSASPGEMREEYEKHPEKYSKGGKTTVAVILLKPEDAAKRAEIDEALKTTDFGEIAKKYSADSKAKDGGVWKDIDPKEVFQEKIADEIAKMPVNTLSNWLDVDGWSFLLKKTAESETRPMPFAEAYDKIEAEVKKANAKKLYDAWIERLKSETYISFN
jgi:parvulin-like peptidyl-prolyl isomerase